MEILITSIIAFTSTNIDDIFILTLFYGNGKFSSREVIAGQILGIASLIAISLIGSLAGLLIDPIYIGLLGFVPIYLGAKGVFELIKGDDDNDEVNKVIPDKKGNILTVAGVTISNGGDNIGIYVPLFATLTWTNKLTMVTVFLLMTFLWCSIAKYFATRPYVARVVSKYGHIVTPFVLILLGIYILYESGAYELIK